MAGKSQERFYLEVLTGDNQGQTTWVNPETSVLIGSSESAGLVLQGAGIKPEHASVHILNGRVWVENLSSGGTLLNGRLIRDRAVVVNNEIIGVGEDTRIALRSTLGGKSDSTSSLLLPILILVLVLGGILMVALAVRPRRTIQRVQPITRYEWQEAYTRIHARLTAWREQGRLPASLVDEFTQAWYREQGGDTEGALAHWNRLYNALASLSVPGATPPGQSVASSAEIEAETLNILMGRDADRNPDNSLLWKGDDRAYASAWWWFVDQRIDELRAEDE